MVYVTYSIQCMQQTFLWSCSVVVVVVVDMKIKISRALVSDRCTPSPSTEEVADRHQSDCGGVALRGRGELLGEAVLPVAAGVRSDVQQPLDVLQAAVQGLQASPGLREHPQTGGEGHRGAEHTDTYQQAETDTATSFNNVLYFLSSLCLKMFEYS